MGTRAKYDRIRSIATGGSAGVHLCRTLGSEGLETLVVVKSLPPAALGDAQRAQGVVHPNLVKLLDVSDDAADAFVAREYLHGEDLGRVAAAAHDNGVPIALDAALALATAVAAAVAHAHAAGLVHGAIEPARVIVGYDGNVKLIDLATPPVSGATHAADVRAIAALIAEHAIGAPDLEAIVARAGSGELADAKALGDALAGYAATAKLAIGPGALARLMESLYPGRREEWVKARKQGAFFVEAHVLQQLESNASPITETAPPVLPPTDVTKTKTTTTTTTHVGVHFEAAPLEIDLEAGSGGLIAPPLPSAAPLPTTREPILTPTVPTPALSREGSALAAGAPTTPPADGASDDAAKTAPRTALSPPPARMPTPVPGSVRLATPVPGAVPIIAAFSTPVPGRLVASSTSPVASGSTRDTGSRASIGATAVDAGPSIAIDDATPAEILSPAMPGERTERVRIPTPLPERPRLAEPRAPRRNAKGPVIAVALLAVLAVAIVVFVVTRTHDSPAAVANPPKVPDAVVPAAAPPPPSAPPDPASHVDDPPPVEAPPPTKKKPLHPPAKSPPPKKDPKWSSDSAFLPVR